ncbi:hypothetical protein [Streptomyces sp. FL07-04A]|uniref:hypothetical protein n=1 Tax=Streptomyces sp. FL07-04A TaxID=3028658 RepID=UPI0029A62759|nr:hypothetical protein [Streptomyces sp. FL07-04A]MDX3575804.1 hypothetical protein [Streptomyces sp. FL07-04A]
MTQSGQGEEPSAQPAREGIVLPSDGGEPLLPGMTPDVRRPSARPRPQPGAAPAPHTGGYEAGPYGQPAEGRPYDRAEGQQPYGHQPQQPQQPHQPYGQPDGQQLYGQPDGQQPYGSQGYGPPDYGQQPDYGQPAAGGQTWEQPWGADQQSPAPQQPDQGWPLPPDQAPPQHRPEQHRAQQQNQWGAPQQDPWDGGRQTGAGPLPPESAPDPAAPAYGQGRPGAPLPPVAAAPAPADEGATQYIPPVPAVPVDEGATQYLPPVPAVPADEGATQYIPPVVPGALPPEVPAESTHFLGRTPQNPGPRHPQAAPGPVPGGHPDAEATQYIPPVAAQDGGDRQQPPAGFESLFRDEPAGDGPAGSTQLLPRFDEPDAPVQVGGPGHGGGPAARSGYARPSYAQPSYAPPGDPSAGGRRGTRDDGGGRRGRGDGTGSRVPLFAAIGVALAVVGVAAGALLGGGGSDKGDDNKTVAASAPVTGQSGSASSDGARGQAAELDKLLADSGSSRASVISAVADVKACGDLARAATDLRDAAKQRTDLVTRLSALKVDRLQDHAALTAALTKAWQASASADDHYAAWADQVAGNKKKNCKRGSARTTGETQAGNRASGTASAQKAQAAKLWNAIARKYGLTERQPTQL